MIKLKEKEYIFIKTVPLIQENGSMINKMDMEYKSGSMAPNIKVILKMV